MSPLLWTILACGSTPSAEAPEATTREDEPATSHTSGKATSASPDKLLDDPAIATNAPSPDELQGERGTKRGPPYPIVLVHGYLGFDDFADAGLLPYFFKVREALAEQDELNVFTPALDPFNASEVRGEQLLEEIEAVLSKTGHEKVNLIAHSQGGLDARVAANLRPDLVATVITVSTPHHGSSAVDALLELTDHQLLAPAIDELFRRLGRVVYRKVDGRTSIMAALRNMSDEGSRAFNEAHADQDQVFYASIAGLSSTRDGAAQYPSEVGECVPDEALPFIEDFAGDRDRVNLFLALLGPWLHAANDGLVPVSSARWGRFWGCVPADHFDEVGQPAGIATPGAGNPWDHRDFYVQLVAHLRQLGF